MKKKLTVGLVCVFVMSLLLAGVALAAIPSSKSSSGVFQNYTATAYGTIHTDMGTAATSYGTYAWSVYAKIEIGFFEGGTYNTSSAAASRAYNTGISVTKYPPSGCTVTDCHTWSRVGYNDTLWNRQLDYSSVSQSWSVTYS